jgi:hypothetical protein
MLAETQTAVGWFIWFWGKVKGWLPKGSSGANHTLVVFEARTPRGAEVRIYRQSTPQKETHLPPKC